MMSDCQQEQTNQATEIAILEMEEDDYGDWLYHKMKDKEAEEMIWDEA